jgi:peptidase T
MERAVDRFLKYVTFDTQSNEDSKCFPSTKSQLVFANYLADECKQIGMKDVCTDKYGYVFATLYANDLSIKEKIGFIAHMDTSPEFSGENISPRIIKNYEGNQISLNENIFLSPTEFPVLKNYIGDDLIVTDGTTLLGADDKAGISEIITAMEYLIKHDEIKHGQIKIAFTPDEEIGLGASKFDVEKFDCDFAYTVDGGQVGELQYENFNAAVAKIIVHGKSVHPGDAKNIMINSILVGNKIVNKFPISQTPQNTEKLEGFYHIHTFLGAVDKTTIECIIRDFDRKNFEARKKFVEQVVLQVQNESNCKIDLSIKDQYYNMREKIDEYIIDRARKAFKKADIIPLEMPIRGGTDGANLSFKNLPCPNVFAGGHNFHGPYEFIPVSSIKKAVEVIINMI